MLSFFPRGVLDEILNLIESVSEEFPSYSYIAPLHVHYLILARYRGLTGGFLLLQNFSVAISVSPHVCFILVLILISIFRR